MDQGPRRRDYLKVAFAQMYRALVVLLAEVKVKVSE
jgi:hypothetical protein